ncbi:hypothetical protein CVIRNUC_000070 [Coccomyxa viridis]|uniref:Uncharacterized protein n=1 Tax=Coccomyxa viridis TaxID=1274662 RepID=A0AAV1HPH4_9CHLO|nr:hypothetical protein CVIRNUC_000070 [Coccomyxa viridis]
MPAGQGFGRVPCHVSAGGEQGLQCRPQVARMLCCAVEALPGSKQPKCFAVLVNRSHDSLLMRGASGLAEAWLGSFQCCSRHVQFLHSQVSCRQGGMVAFAHGCAGWPQSRSPSAVLHEQLWVLGQLRRTQL